MDNKPDQAHKSTAPVVPPKDDKTAGSKQDSKDFKNQDKDQDINKGPVIGSKEEDKDIKDSKSIPTKDIPDKVVYQLGEGSEVVPPQLTKEQTKAPHKE
jgi:hypothetical protein